MSLSQDDWDFIVDIAKQHSRISDVTLAALENQNDINAKLRHCRNRYLALVSEVAAITSYGDRTKLEHAIQDVLKDVEDWRVVAAWMMDNMINHKPSDLDEMLQAREAKISKKYSFAKKVSEYNQPNPTPKKTKKQNFGPDR
jgi:hypothetical protein